VIMGSSRMKSGTAHKLILNAISTGVMIRLGHVYSNLMIDMPATNEKLRSRAVRMVELAAGVTRPMAVQALRDADGNVRIANGTVDIGAFEFGSTPPTTTTPTVAGATTTTTTLPGCAAVATTASVRCRLASLSQTVGSATTIR